MISSIVGMTGISLVLYLTGFFVFFTPFPFIFLALRRGFFPAAMSLSLGLAVLLLLYRLPSTPFSFLPLAGFHARWGSLPVAAISLIYFFYYGWLGLTVAFVSKTSLSVEKGVFGIVAAALLVPIALLIAFSRITGFPLVEEFRGSLSYVFDRIIAMQENSKVAGEEALFLKEYAPVIVRRVVEIIPALWIDLTLFITSLNIVFLKRWAAADRPFSSWVDYSLWRLNERWIWLPIGGGAFYFLNLYLLQSGLLRAVLVNGLLVLGAVYFLQGLAIVSFFFKKRFSPLLRMMAYFLILLFVQMIGIAIVVLGLFDFWFDFRKLKKIA